MYTSVGKLTLTSFLRDKNKKIHKTNSNKGNILTEKYTRMHPELKFLSFREFNLSYLPQ